MTSPTAAGSNGQPNSAVSRTLSSLFGVAAASSLRNAVPPRAREVEEITSELDEPVAVERKTSTSKSTEADAPHSRNEGPSNTRIAVSSDSSAASSSSSSSSPPPPPSSSAVSGESRAPTRRFRSVQVRDRRFIHIFLLAAAKRAPTGQMLIDFVRECSDGVFDLPRGVVYRELHKLEKERLITVRRGIRERRYMLTNVGERTLATRRREWETFSHGLARLLEEADDGSRRGVSDYSD
jgi:DNA-binding PadR family transcriptional regulator